LPWPPNKLPLAAQLGATGPMAPPAKVAKAEALWRKAWVGSPHCGKVGLEQGGAPGEERLVVKCKDVALKQGAEAEIVDDGRTVGVAVGDYVSFGIVLRPGQAPAAVNIWRDPGAKKRKRQEALGDVEPSRAPSSVQGALIGVVRNQSGKTGDYFIDCEKVNTTYGRDAKIRRDNMPEDIGIGDAIVFEVDPPPNDTAAPIAVNVKRAVKAAAQAALARFRENGGARPGGKGGGGGYGGGYGGGKSAPRRHGRSGTTMRMVGIVKRVSPHTGRRFVFCQDISDVYGKDAQIPPEEVPPGGLNIGDRISFDIEEPPDGVMRCTPLARNVKKLGGVGKSTLTSQAAEGDGEDEAEPEAEEEQEPEDDVEEKPGVEEQEETEAAERLEQEVSRRANGVELCEARGLVQDEEEAADPTTADPPADNEAEPTTTEGWIAAQDRLFHGQPKLKAGWIRIRSKTRGLVYYYNTKNGESSGQAPLR